MGKLLTSCCQTHLWRKRVQWSTRWVVTSTKQACFLTSEFHESSKHRVDQILISFWCFPSCQSYPSCLSENISHQAKQAYHSRRCCLLRENISCSFALASPTSTLCQLIRQRNKGLPNFNAVTMVAEIPPWTRRSRELGLLQRVKLVFFQHLSCENSEENIARIANAVQCHN